MLYILPVLFNSYNYLLPYLKRPISSAEEIASCMYVNNFIIEMDPEPQYQLSNLVDNKLGHLLAVYYKLIKCPVSIYCIYSYYNMFRTAKDINTLEEHIFYINLNYMRGL